MFGARWQICRILGIPIYLDASWLIILALLTVTLSNVIPSLLESYYPETVGSPAPWVYWMTGLVTAVGFFGCILLHELGHAVVARAQRMPIRGITLFLFGGVADVGDDPPSARAEFLMAIAGPVVSVVLAVLLGVLAGVGYQMGWAPVLVIELGYLASINAIVLAFNMVPAFPLDGGRVLRSALWGATGDLRRATYWSSLAGRIFAWVLIAWGAVNFLGGNWFGGVWIGLIGMFLNTAALMGYQQLLIRQALEGEPVRRFMNPDPITVPATLDLRSWVENYVYRHHRKAYPVVSDGHLEGLVETSALGSIPREEWDRHTVGEVMRQDLTDLLVSPQADSVKALRRMQRSGSSRLLVTEGDRLLGILSLKDLLGFLSLKMELEGEDADERPKRGKVPAETAGDEHERSVLVEEQRR